MLHQARSLARLADYEQAERTPEVALLRSGHFAWVMAIFAEYMTDGPVPAAEFHEYVDLEIGDLRANGVDVPDGRARDHCNGWVAKKWLYRALNGDSEEYGLTAASLDARAFTDRLIRRRSTASESRLKQIIDAVAPRATDANPDPTARLRRLDEDSPPDERAARLGRSMTGLASPYVELKVPLDIGPCVYRCWDTDDRCIYVGKSSRRKLLRRVNDHMLDWKHRAQWWKDVVRVDYLEVANEQTADIEERRQVFMLRPLHNVVFNCGHDLSLPENCEPGERRCLACLREQKSAQAARRKAVRDANREARKARTDARRNTRGPNGKRRVGSPNGTRPVSSALKGERLSSLSCRNAGGQSATLRSLR